MNKIITNFELETIKFGIKFAKTFKSATVLGLVGDLGAGKTQLTKGIARGLGIKDHITSPTFVLLKEYSTDNFNLIHIDCYRLSSSEEVLGLGWSEFINHPKNIIVVEWADKIKDIMPQNTIWIKLKMGLQANQRIISF